MKQTIFQFKEGSENIELVVDFIYEPILNSDIENLVDIDGQNHSFSIHKIIDHFTQNPMAQIRYVKLGSHEKQIL